MSAEQLTRPTVCVAPTARSKCQSCSEKIESGSQRVGMPARHAGLSVTRWLHPVCFVNNLLVDTAPSSRANVDDSAAEPAPISREDGGEHSPCRQSTQQQISG
uniref:PARP-type domain-containing protein n=1 Tax=Chrysotila carterae TaxID=13221 RepID=A0A7S4BRL1_CHRCT